MRDKLTWYGRRLRAMDASEVVSRSRAAIAEVGDGLLEVVPGLWGVRWEPDSARLLERNPIDEPVGFMRVERAALLGARVSRETDALVARAELALDGRVQFFGYRETHVGEDSDRDPLTGRTWPNRRAKRIDYRRTDVGDPKWIWELHRCQDASRLAAAWLATRDARYGQGAGRRITTWVLHNTPGRGMAWSSGFEAALRAISFALAFDALRGSPQFVDPHLVLRSLWQHGRWIMRDPSVGSSANNHRIAELVGMLVIGCLAPELRDSTRWRRLAVAELSHEVGRQIRPDGTSAEQAFSYHVFVVDLVLLAVAVLEATKHAVPMELEAAVRRSGDALWAQLGEGESAPTYGDTDDGRAFVLDGGDLRDPRGVAAGIAARFGHAGARYVAQDVDASVCWLFGESGIQRFDGVEAAPPPESVSLPCAGLTIIRRRGRRFIVDHGPHGHTTLAAHAHADALSVDASLGGVELVVDPGVGSYFARPAWRSAFRGTGFHPTVVVDGLDSSVSGGSFLWTTHARAKLLLLDIDRGIVVAEHDGYQRLRDPVNHRRAVIALPDGSALVVDRLAAEGRHRYAQRWPLHPRLAVEACSETLVVARAADTNAGVALMCPPQEVRVSSAHGVIEPLAGWWSERLESVVPSWLVSFDAEATGALELVTLVTPFEHEPPSGVALEATRIESGTQIRIRGMGAPGTIEVDLRTQPVRVSM